MVLLCVTTRDAVLVVLNCELSLKTHGRGTELKIKQLI